jgi:hypothetical protein
VLLTQAAGQERRVATLKRYVPPTVRTVTADRLPELDGAPGGTLGGFGILHAALSEAGADVVCDHPEVCFVPTTSAVAIRDLDGPLRQDVSALDPDDSELDEFKCASGNEPHTAVTDELCTWLYDRMTAL